MLWCTLLRSLLACWQVAAHAEHHIVVRKSVNVDGRAATQFAVLQEEAERAQEVGAMLGLGPAEALQMLQSVAQ